MQIIDAHMHFSNVQAFYSAANESGVDFSLEGYKNEMIEHRIIASVCMGLQETEPHAFPDKRSPVPMTADLSECYPPNMYTCLGINPHRINSESLKNIKKLLDSMFSPTNKIVGFKIYAGYYHYYVHDPIYAPIYKLASEYGLTVAIHTGVTYSEEGLMEYSHPLAADRLAVQFRDTQFLLCHMGNPWVMDACEVAYKNRNVFLDISGLIEGSAEHIQKTMETQELMQHYTTGLLYLNDYKKVLFGTDWPIVPYGTYIDFCKKIIPEQSWSDVFRDNAVNVYKLPY